MKISKQEANSEAYLLRNDKAALTALQDSFERHDAGATSGKSIDDIFIDLLFNDKTGKDIIAKV